MAARLENTIYDFEGQAWTISIHDSSYASSAIPINITQANIQYQAESRERFAALIPSVANVSFQIDGATLESFVTDFIGAAEKRFQLVIKKGSSQFWIGNVVTDNVTKQDKEWPYIFNIQATDGLAALKDVDYNNAGADYTGRERIVEHVINALNKIGTDTLFSSAILSTAIHWYSADHAALTNDPIYNTRFDHRRYIKIDSSGVKTYYNSYEVLQSICEAFGARMFMTDGTFHMVSINDYEGANFKLYHYDNTATETSTTAAATYRKTDGTDIIRLFGGSYKFYPALRESIVRYTHYQAQSVIPPNALTASDYTGPEIDTSGGTAKLLMRLDYRFDVAYSDPNNFVPLRMVIDVKVKIGSYWLKRDATVDSSTGAVTYGEVEWSVTEAYFQIATPTATEDSYTFFGTVNDFITPPIPADGDIVVSADYNAVYSAAGSTITTFNTATVIFYNAYFEVVPEGTVEDRSNEFVYRTENDNTDNSKKYSVNVELGDAPSAVALGALQVYDGAAWDVSSGWGVNTLSGTEEIGQLLSQEIVKTQSFPVEIISATYNGHYSPLYAIYKGSEYYIPSAVNIDLIEAKASGQWFMVDSTGSATTDKTKDAPFEPESGGISYSTPRSPSTGKSQEDSTAVISPAIQQSLLYKAKVVGTASDITAGASVSSIGIDQIGEDDVIREDDVITVVDITTGQIQSFTVTSDVAATDSSISVSTQTADHDFREGSIVTTDATQTLKSRKQRFRQRFTGHTSTTCTITENGGTLPSAEYIDVVYNGQELDTADWSISGSDIILAFTPNGLIVVKFWA